MPKDPHDELDEINKEMLELKERLKDLNAKRKQIHLGDCEVEK